MKVLTFRDFMKKYKLKTDTMTESQLQKIYKLSIYPRDSKNIFRQRICKNRQWISRRYSLDLLYSKRYKSYYFDSFGGQPDKFLLYRSPKPIIYHSYNIQDINSELCASLCLYFF